MLHFAIARFPSGEFWAYKVSDGTTTIEGAQSQVRASANNSGDPAQYIFTIIDLGVWVLDPVYEVIHNLLVAMGECGQFPFDELFSRIIAESFKAGLQNASATRHE